MGAPDASGQENPVLAERGRPLSVAGVSRLATYLFGGEVGLLECFLRVLGVLEGLVELDEEIVPKALLLELPVELGVELLL